MRFADTRSDSYQSYMSMVNNGIPVGGTTQTFNKMNRYNISERFYTWRLIDLNITFDMSNDDGSGFRTGTLTSTATRRELQSTSDGLSRKMTADISKRISLSEKNYNFLDFSYTFTWEDSHKLKTSFDLADADKALIDTTNTYNFTNDYNTHKASVELGITFPKIKAHLNVKSAFSSAGINRDENFPEKSLYDKRFNAFLPSVSFGSLKMMNNIIVQYMTYTQLPSIEQLRPYLNDANPYMLVAGNQRLKQSYSHHLHAGYSTMFGKANNNIMIVVDVKKTDDVIAYKRTFFTQATYLPEWDNAPAQSTLTSYENVDGWWVAKADIKWVRPLRKLKSQLTVNAVLNYDDTPSFVDDVLNRTQSYAPELRLGLRANISRSFRFSVGTRTSPTETSKTEA